MNVPILLIDYGCGCVTVTVNTFQTFPHLEKSPFLVFKWIALISLIGFLTNCIHPLSIPPPFFEFNVITRCAVYHGENCVLPDSSNASFSTV